MYIFIYWFLTVQISRFFSKAIFFIVVYKLLSFAIVK